MVVGNQFPAWFPGNSDNEFEDSFLNGGVFESYPDKHGYDDLDEPIVEGGGEPEGGGYETEELL